MKLIKNIYGDMRDRRLLIPAVILLVALIAVPVVLSQSAEKAMLAPAPSGDSLSDDLAATPAVLASDDIGIRKYERRLELIQSKDPFEQQYQSSPAQTDVGVTVDEGAGAGDGGASITVDSGDGESVTVDDGGDAPETPTTDVVVESELYTLRVDVKIGIQGEAQLHGDVKPNTMLPSQSNPVVSYLGTDESGKKASFVLSRTATAVGGDGSCVPTPADCAYVTLTKGQAAVIESSTDGEIYRLELVGIKRVVK